MTSWARASSDDGGVRPSALAVLRLTTSSDSVGASPAGGRLLDLEDTIDVAYHAPVLPDPIRVRMRSDRRVPASLARDLSNWQPDECLY